MNYQVCDEEIACNSFCNNDGNDCNVPIGNINYYCSNTSVRYPNCKGNPTYIGNNDCDLEYKNFACNYDGGDCCNLSWIGDGDCDPENNFRSCGNFDGGDCQNKTQTYFL